MSFLHLIVILVFVGNALCQTKHPIIEDLIASSKLVENEKFFIICQVKHGPVQFDWLLNGRPVVNNENITINNHEDNSMLNIRKMSLEYAGNYECQIKNSMNQEDSRTISVKLNGR